MKDKVVYLQNDDVIKALEALLEDVKAGELPRMIFAATDKDDLVHIGSINADFYTILKLLTHIQMHTYSDFTRHNLFEG